MCDKTDFQIPAEHLIFLATLLEEQDNEENWNELQNAFDESSKGQLFFLEVCPERTKPGKTAHFTTEDRAALAMSYRQEAEKIIEKRDGVYWPYIRGENLSGIAHHYEQQGKFEEAAKNFRRAIRRYRFVNAIEGLMKLPNFENSVENIRTAIFGLTELDKTQESREKALDLISRHKNNPLIKADLAKMYFSEDPSEKNETSFKLLNEAGFTDHLELASFMAQRFFMIGDDQKTFYWWAVAIKSGLEDLREVLAFTAYISTKYHESSEQFSYPVLTDDQLSINNVESYYLPILGMTVGDTLVYEDCREFLNQLAEKNPLIHRTMAYFFSFYGDFAAFIDEICQYIDGLDSTSDDISKNTLVLKGTLSPEEYIERVIARNRIYEIDSILEKRYQECEPWWKIILSSKHPKRFAAFFKFIDLGIRPPNYMYAIPIGDVVALYRLTQGSARVQNLNKYYESHEEFFSELYLSKVNQKN